MVDQKNKKEDYFDGQDEIINVMLPKSDYKIMRDMIDRQKSLNWIGRYFRNVVFVAAGGLIALIAFGDQFKAMFSKFFG